MQSDSPGEIPDSKRMRHDFDENNIENDIEMQCANFDAADYKKKLIEVYQELSNARMEIVNLNRRLASIEQANSRNNGNASNIGQRWSQIMQNEPAHGSQSGRSKQLNQSYNKHQILSQKMASLYSNTCPKKEQTKKYY